MKQEEVVIRRAQAGDRAAFRQLVETYRNYVFTITLRILRTRAEAEEAAMDVFLKVARSLQSFKFQSKFSTWLYTLAYRTAIDRLRTKQSGRITLHNIDEYAWTNQVSKEKGPGRQLEEQDLQRELNKALDQLPPEDAILISLYYLREKSVREVAKITGLSTSNVKVKLYRLRSALKEILEKQLQGELSDWL